MSNLFFLKTSLGKLSIYLPHLEQPPTSPAHPPLIIRSILWAFKTPPLNIWPALRVCIFMLLLLARTKGLLCFQEAWEFADSWRFWKVKKQNHLMSPTVTPQLIILNLFCNLLLLCSYLRHLVAGINTSPMPWKLMSYIFPLLCGLIHCLWFSLDFFLKTI